MSHLTDGLPVQTLPNQATPPTSRRAPTEWSIRGASLVAGVSLLLMAVVAIFGNVIVVDGLVTQGDAAQTATDLGASQGLWQLGIGSLMLVIVLDVVVAWALYRVFSPVSASLSMLAAILRLVYSAVFMVAVAQLVDVTRLLNDDSARAALGADQVEAQALLGIGAFNDIWYVGQVLFGAHLLLIGYLAFRSGYIPRVLGVLLAISGVGYCIDSFGGALSQGSWTDVTAFTFLGEFLLALWLVFRARRVATEASALESAANVSPTMA